MNNIKYITGNALEPLGDKRKVIVHVCNDVGGWGSGFVVAISKKWSEPEEAYRLWAKEHSNPESPRFYDTFHLGMVQAVQVEKDIHVCNMIGQSGCNPADIPIRYNAVETCLNKVAMFIDKEEVSVHMPRIGSGLAGGKWNEIEKIVIKTLVERGIDTYVYTLEGDNSWR